MKAKAESDEKYQAIAKAKIRVIMQLRSLKIGETVSITRLRINKYKDFRKITGKVIYRDDYKVVLEVKPWRRVTMLTNDLINPIYKLTKEGE